MPWFARRALLLPLLLATCLTGLATASADEPFFEHEAILQAEQKHNHASCIVQKPDGGLFVAWYRGTGERQADDVEIWAAAREPGQTSWNDRFLLADTPGYPDCNPAIFTDAQGRLWLWRPVIIDHRWEGALLKFSVTSRWPEVGKPVHWDQEGVLHVTPVGFAEAAAEALNSLEGKVLKLDESAFTKAEERSKDLLYQRLGWMPRVHPIVLPSGRLLLPLYTDTFSCSIIMRSDDQGQTWQAGAPMIGWGNIQPSLVRKNDGTIVAYMRDNGPYRRIRVSSSTDEGVTWSPVTSSELPNPGAGIEAIRLASGRWAMIYNDTTKGRHSLALSLSDDEGQTWKWTRHVALAEPGTRSFHYPSIIQAADGSIHVSYTHGGQAEGSSIDHARFNEAWVLKGDEAKPAP